MITPTIYSIKNLVGNDENSGAPRVDGLISLLYRTVAPETWFVEGGTGSIRGFYNVSKTEWFLVVYTEGGADVTNAIQAVLSSLAQ